MIVLPNYLVAPGHPQLCAFGVVLCHPDDRPGILRELREHEQMVASFEQAISEAHDDE